MHLITAKDESEDIYMKRFTTTLLLITIITQSCQLIAMDRSLVPADSFGSSVASYLDTDLKWTEQITLKVSTGYTIKNPKSSALLGALVGGAVIGACIQRFGNNWSPIKKYGLIFGGSVISSAISFLVHYDRMERDLKEDQRKIDYIWWQHRSAFNACKKACGRRSLVMRYLHDTREINRLNLYISIYNYLKKNARSIYKNSKKNDHPIKDAIKFLNENLTDKIKSETSYLANLKRNMASQPQFKSALSQATIDQIAEMFKQMRQNAEIIERLNSILSHDKIQSWINEVKVLPEYKTVFDASDIFDLTNRAIEHKCELRKTFLTLARQRRLCRVFINGTIETIREIMNDYQAIAKELNTRIDAYNVQILQIPTEIRRLLQHCGHGVYELNVYPMNPSLLQYEKFLADDFNDENEELEKWIETCFSDVATVKT